MSPGLTRASAAGDPWLGGRAGWLGIMECSAVAALEVQWQTVPPVEFSETL